MMQPTPKAAPKEVLDLTGRKGLVVGIANEHSLAWAAAEHLHNAGAELAITYLNDQAKPYVEPLARHCQSKFVYLAKTSEPDFAVIDFPAFFRVDLGGSIAAPSI